jgi:hypothetical protein
MGLAPELYLVPARAHHSLRDIFHALSCPSRSLTVRVDELYGRPFGSVISKMALYSLAPCFIYCSKIFILLCPEFIARWHNVCMNNSIRVGLFIISVIS